MAKNVNLCSTHRTYEAKSPPRIECYDCWDVFFELNPRFRRLLEVLLRNER